MSRNKFGAMRPVRTFESAVTGEATTGNDNGDEIVVTVYRPEGGLQPVDVAPARIAPNGLQVQPQEIQPFVPEADRNGDILPSNGPPGGLPEPGLVAGGMLEGAGEFFQKHKKKILVGGGVLAAIGLWLKFRK